MSDLRFIMDMDDHEPDPRMNKGNHEPSPASNRGSNPSRSASMNQGYDHSASASLSRPLGLTSRSSPNSASVVPALSTVSDLGNLSRRESTASTESMDPPGYGGRGRGTSSGPMRPMGSPSAVDNSLRLTPITRRVSRAKKGVPVHTCETCRPPKTFTRAEHLRRHNLSHQNPRFACLHPGCDKVFHRQDLLNRHKPRHDQDELSSSQGDIQSRRQSATPLDDRYGYMMTGPATMGNHASSHRTAPSMSSVTSYGGESSSSYGPETYVNSSGQVVTRTMSPSRPQTRQQAGYAGQHQHMSVGGAHVNYQGSNNYRMPPASPEQVSGIHHKPSSLNNTPTTPPRTFNPMFPDVRSPALAYVHQEVDVDSQPLPTLTIPDAVPSLLTPHDSSWDSTSESNYSTPPEAQTRRPNLRAPSPPCPDWPGTFILAYTPQSPVQSMELSQIPSLFSSHSFPSFTQYPAFNSDVPISYQEDHVAILDQAHGQDLYFSVRSLTPRTASYGAQPPDNLVTISTAVLGTLPVLGLDGHKEPELGMLPLHMGNPHMTTVSLPQAIISSIPCYLEVYWERFDVQFPLVHRASFEALGNELLQYAMGAIATQFMPNKEDHVKGKQLHEFAVAELRRARGWDNLPTMQAILLCEYYARFRGRKVVVNASRAFREMYTRVIRDQATPGMASPTMDAVAESLEQRWRRWTDIEARRRLQTGCFLLDVNTALLYEQTLLKPITATSPPIPLTVQTSQPWNASTASSWELAVSLSDANMPLAFSPMVDTLTPERLSSAPPLDIAVYLAAEVLRILPVGNRAKLNSLGHTNLAASEYLQRLFSWSPMASTYTALSCTPLHDLLAVSGDSWIFAIKVLTTEQFREHQTRLKDWCKSRQALCAAKFAAKALCSFLALEDEAVASDITVNATNDIVSYNVGCPGKVPKQGAQHQRHSPQLGFKRPMEQAQCDITFARAINYKISDYWAAYVCALVCWAVCRQAELLSTTSRSGYTNMSAVQHSLPGRDKWQPQDWLRQAARASPDELLCLPSEGIASGIVGLARARLQYEAVGGTSGLLNDALDVLSKLQERGSAAFLTDL